ncbi:uncharacterized protein B0I36DRAFT_250774 [Microdochium trichocladiopsis]|uniref:Short-chain dehydrogenase n=1 Tax=Microdochium trichocladiopsis TaxID=1682393 RepID=A0A9P8XY48_9PEZI|nr:uncharacterized protein B0I36DRAFT_250774 [Microdochium trichocladiopsis]KAH7024932.1 hypothetical protein B0I36DRAFT_250774 [Microdochium trichocladiopsis]
MSTLSALYGLHSVIRGRFCVTLPIPAPSSELASQTFIVTGANSGLGYESCLQLARIGAGRLILAVRTLSKGEEAKQKILATTTSNNWRSASSPIDIQVWQLDMDSFVSIKAFAGRCATELDRIDGVLANAGIMTAKLDSTEKFEKTLQVNVLGTLYLYLLLLPAMRASAARTGVACRFTIPNSALHYSASTAEILAGLKDGDDAAAGREAARKSSKTPIIDRLNDPEKADMAARYPLSKLLILYAVRELSSRSNSNSSSSSSTTKSGNVILNTPNPSFCKSDLARESAGSKGFQAFERVMARTAEEGSRTLVHGLLGGPETDGQYLADCRVEVPAKFVTNQWGQMVQKKFVDELLVRLERVDPGISSNI